MSDALPKPALTHALTSTTYDRVHAAMVRDIVSGAFPPGSRLKVAELSQRYGLSQMPIREALQRLQGEGVVVVTPNRGARVRSIDAKFIHDVYDMRATLSVVIYRDLFAQLDDSIVAVATRIQERYDAALAAGDDAGCDAENANLHVYIRSFCRNDEVRRVMSMSDPLVAILRATYGYSPQRRQEQSPEHWAIVNAMKRRSYEDALVAEERHRSNGVADLIKRFMAKQAMTPADQAPTTRPSTG